MNREIKFRAFVYSTTSGAKPNQMRYEDNKTIFDWIADGVGAHVMQFTGLLDNNGKEIYEGDIIDINQTVNGQSKFLIKACLPFMDVRYLHDNRPYEYTIHDLLDAYRDEKEIEIIGNIYENPELLQ